MKKWWKAVLIIILSVAFVFFYYLFFYSSDKPKEDSYDMNLHYYEDVRGDMDLEAVREIFESKETSWNKNGVLNFGNSTSTYWVQVSLKELKSIPMPEYMLVYNPTVEKAILYLPVRGSDGTKYQPLVSGWTYGVKKNDEGFAYPTFHIDSEIDRKEVAYLQLYSPFTQNYSIDFISLNEFKQNRQNSFLLYGILFGILFAMAIQSLFTYSELRDKAHLCYVIYMVMMSLYQGCLLGIYNVWMPDYAPIFMKNTIVFSYLSMFAAVVFFHSFLRINEEFHKYKKWMKVVYSSLLLGFIITLINHSSLANIYAHMISVVLSVILFVMAIGAYKKGFQPAKLFILGWIFMMIGLGISILRNFTLIPNNVITINITLIAAAIQSIWFSTALVQTVKILMTQKETAIRQYYEEKERAKSHELAFLQAQIKPHFLYNTLNVIISLCSINPAMARKLLLDLSEYLHHSFDFYPEQKLVFIDEELACVQAYIRIEQARFPDKIDVNYELDSIDRQMIPPLILQPLVENAIVHGIRKNNNKGIIVVRCKKEEDFLRIEVEDDGIGMTEEQMDKILSSNWHQGKGVGIMNINKRLKAIYGEGLRIVSTPGKGTVVSFRIRRENTLIEEDKWKR